MCCGILGDSSSTSALINTFLRFFSASALFFLWGAATHFLSLLFSNFFGPSGKTGVGGRKAKNDGDGGRKEEKTTRQPKREGQRNKGQKSVGQKTQKHSPSSPFLYVERAPFHLRLLGIPPFYPGIREINASLLFLFFVLLEEVVGQHAFSIYLPPPPQKSPPIFWVPFPSAEETGEG